MKVLGQQIYLAYQISHFGKKTTRVVTYPDAATALQELERVNADLGEPHGLKIYFPVPRDFIVDDNVRQLMMRCRLTVEELELVCGGPQDGEPVFDMLSDIPLDQFSALRILRLRGCALADPKGYLSRMTRLTRLELLSYQPIIPGMSVSAFVDALQSCGTLKELIIQDYLTAFNGHEEDLWGYPPLLPLRRLEISESSKPHYIASFLKRVRVPENATIKLTATHNPWYMADMQTLSSMLPEPLHRTRCLPILGQVVGIEIDASYTSPSQGYKLVGVAGRAKNSITIEVVRAFGGLRPTRPMDPRAAISSLVDKLPDLFPSGKALHALTCTGDFELVRQDSWLGVFQAYPQLSTLAVHEQCWWRPEPDLGLHFVDLLNMGRVSALLGALRYPAADERSIVCFNLNVLGIYGARQSRELKQAVMDFAYARFDGNAMLPLMCIDSVVAGEEQEFTPEDREWIDNGVAQFRPNSYRSMEEYVKARNAAQAAA